MSPRMSCILAILLAIAGDATAAELNTLSELRVQAQGAGTEVVVAGNRAPTFTVFRLSGPDRLVVDVSSADASTIKGHHTGHGPITGIVASQFSDERSSVARLLLALEGAPTYDVRTEGKRVVIAVQGKAGAAKVAEAPPPKPEQPAAAAKPEVAAAPAANTARPNVTASRVDEQPVRNKARRVTGLRFSDDRLHIAADGQFAKYEILELGDPPRLALDLFDVTLAAKAPRVKSKLLGGVRAASREGHVRLVLDMKGAMPAYEVVRKPTGVEVRLRAKDAAQPAVVATDAEGSEPEIEIDGEKIVLNAPPREPGPSATPKTETAAVAPKGLAEVKDIAFRDTPEGGTIEVKLSSEVPFKVERPDGQSAVLTLDRASLPKKLERSLDTSALDTPVRMISAFSVPGAEHQVRVVVAAAGAIEEQARRTASGLSWRLSVKGVKTEEVQVAQKTAGFTTEAPTYVAEGTPKARRYVGKRVSFEFKDIDIHNLLRIIAEVSKRNIVVADDVKGTVTIRLRNVPWDQALELILRSKGLGQEQLGNNIIRVAPLKVLEEEMKVRAERKKAQMVQEELVVQLIPVNYAQGDEMMSRVKDILSERGTVSVDKRTNVLIVKDIASNINRARSLVTNLDTQTPQVLIESRIVEASTSFTRQIGVQWGGHAQAAQGTGNQTGLSFPNVVSARGGSSPDGNAGTADTPNFAVNLPAAVGAGSGGALGFIFGSAGGAVALNLRLSALESQGNIKTISAPKVTTLDNNTALISQGVSIPFSQVSASGVNTSFMEARLSLQVTPHITQDGSILMNIRAENNQPDPSNTGANGQPAIQRKEAVTQVLVKDGDTTVIGGIYVRRGATNEARVPFFSKIPLLGFFFKNFTETDQRQELLIFITPRIINRQTIAQTL